MLSMPCGLLPQPRCADALLICLRPPCLEPCIARLFQRGRAHPCPACGCSTRAEDFLEQPKETRKVASEAKVRRQVCDIFCKSEEDFPSLAEYNDFLEQRENIIYRLVNPSTPEEVQEAWRSIDQYREQNAEQILRAQNLQPRKKVQKILSIINEEGGFCAAVNSDWDERQAQTNLVHPFQDRYRDFLQTLLVMLLMLKMMRHLHLNHFLVNMVPLTKRAK